MLAEIKNAKTSTKIIFSIILLVVAMFAFYFLYFVKTPFYSLYILRNAIRDGNIYKFEYHYDMDKVYESVFDDSISDASKKGNDSFGSALALGLINTVKPNIVLQMKEATRDGINGTIKLDQIKSDNLASIVYGGISYMFSAVREGLNSSESVFELKDYKVLNEEEYSANVRLVVYNTKTEKEIILDLLLSRLQDGKWKVVKITNFKRLFERVNADATNLTKNNSGSEKQESKVTQVASDKDDLKQEKKAFTEEQIKTSSFVREKLASESSKVEHKNGETSYLFTGSIHSAKRPTSLVKFINKIAVDNKTGKVGDYSVISLVTNQKECLGFDSILFSSDDDYYTVDVPAWVKHKLGYKLDSGINETSTTGTKYYGTGFGSNISSLREAFKVMAGKNPGICFFKGKKALLYFDIDSRTAVSLVESHMLVDIMGKKLKWEDGMYLY